MAKAAPDATLDSVLTKIATAIRQTVCSAEPVNYAQIASFALAQAEMVPGVGNDFTISNAPAGGRRMTVAGKPNKEVEASGAASHVALDDGTNLLFVTTCQPQTLTDGNTVSFPAWNIEIGDPT